MVIDKEYLADLVSRIVPEEATSVEALMSASAHAAAEFDKFVPELRVRTAILTSPFARKEEIARASYRFLLERRNAWLKQHGAYNRG